MGAPSLRASTDIYDARVIRETYRREGTIFLLGELESRRPPAIAPNWNTSYRLPCSGLVAVAKLDYQKEALSRKTSLQWAEIVNYEQNSKFPDGRYRQQGYVL